MQSTTTDANLNGDPAADRVMMNPNGRGTTGSGIHAINAAGETVDMNDPNADLNSIAAYVADDPTAKYVVAGPGTIPTPAGRNTLPLRPTNNLDLTLMKRFSITERVKFEVLGQFSNTLNHPQFTGGYLNHVDGGNPSLVSVLQSGGVLNMLTPGTSSFNRPDLAFSSNPRTIVLAAKITF